MSFASSQFSVGELVRVREDIQNPKFAVVSGMTGTIAEVVWDSLRIWRRGDTVQDYAYRINFYVPANAPTSPKKLKRFMQMVRDVEVPGIYLELSNTTVVVRKMSGRSL